MRTAKIQNCLVLLCLTATLIGSGCRPKEAKSPAISEGRTVVIVHGAWGGAWQFSKVQPLLEKNGHRVYRPTMTGLGERVHLASPEIDLETHILDIVNVLEFEDLTDVVLVGHSYGGMVIAGVAERVPHRLAKLIYMDALLPEDGESLESLFGREAVESMAEFDGDGGEAWKLVPRWVEEGQKPPVDVPQPIRTFTDPITIANPEAAALPGAFLLTVEKDAEGDDFAAFAERARKRGWPVVEMEAGHNPQWYQPENFVEVLLPLLE